jgi:hypothetical protein
MTRWMRAVPALLALVLAAAACTGDGDDGSRATFPLQATSVTLAANCDSVRSVPSPGPNGVLEAGTMTTISQAGTFGLSPSGVPLRVTLSGSGDYFVTTWQSNAFGAVTTTFSARGIADGTGVRQWMLQGPGSIQLTPVPGTSFTVVVCAA